MKIITILVFSTLLIVYTANKQVSAAAVKEPVCASILDLSELIMSYRQNNISLEEMYQFFESKQNTLNGSQTYELLNWVDRAYDEPIYKIKEKKFEAIKNFKEDIKKKCKFWMKLYIK